MRPDLLSRNATSASAQNAAACPGWERFNRRGLLKLGGAAAGACWLTPVAELLARQQTRPAPAQAIIMLWLAGGPSQLETFDPHPGAEISAGTTAIKTNVPGIQLASGLERIAERMDRIALVRSVVSKEGDHERATYNAKTGFRPDPTLIHPSIGAVACYQLQDNVEIPRHVSILPGPWAARGGYLGDQFDAFKIGDPQQPIPDVAPRVPEPQFQRRVDDLLDVVEGEFARGRIQKIDQQKTLHGLATKAALRMMSSEQLRAFDVNQVPRAVRDPFGDSPFGRGCLAAGRLVEAGVRCVEVTLTGWDTHANNHALQRSAVDVLDPALAGLLDYLRERDLLNQTLVICGGEFGRTPRLNPASGRDHWPHGFTIALAGGGIRGGQVYGETSPTPDLEAKQPAANNVARPRNIADIHATALHLLGVDFREELPTPIKRPMAISKGEVIGPLINA